MAYFALPPDVSNLPELNPSPGPNLAASGGLVLSELEKYRRLFLSFMSIPASEQERRLAWGLPPVRPSDKDTATEAATSSDSGTDGGTQAAAGDKSSKLKKSSSSGSGWMKIPSDINWSSIACHHRLLASQFPSMVCCNL